MKTHELKTDPKVFQQTWEGRKTFEIRKDDRDYQSGDVLVLRETLFSGAQMTAGAVLHYTARSVVQAVTGILRGPVYGLTEGWCIMSVSNLWKSPV